MNDGSTSIVDSLKLVLDIARAQDQDQATYDNRVESTINKRTESSPWLRKTGWIELFEGKDMTALCNHTLNEGRDFTENAIVASIKRVIERCITGVRDLEKRGWSKV